MRKAIMIFFSLICLPLLGGFVHATPGERCDAVYNASLYTGDNYGSLVQPNPSAAVTLCGAPYRDSCDQGEYCHITCAVGYHNTRCEEGESYRGDCRTGSFCCALAGARCQLPSIDCCDTTLTCNPYVGGDAGAGECMNCSMAGQYCTSDEDCCSTDEGSDAQLICDTSNVCAARPPEPAMCGGNIGIGEICDWDSWSGDDGRCSHCVNPSRTSHVDAGLACAGLSPGEQCIDSCQCNSGLSCYGDPAGISHCSTVTCVNTFGAPCSDENPCCAYINSTRAECVTRYGFTVCGEACGSVPAGTACSSNQDCCPSVTGLYCFDHVCGDDSEYGYSCEGYGSCGPSAGCPLGQMCDRGLCSYSVACTEALENIEYTGPIVNFSDLLSRVYFFLYPAGIAVGLFFIAKAGYTIMMSEGNPAKVSEGKDELTSAVIGTIFILLSLVILRVIISALLGATM